MFFVVRAAVAAHRVYAILGVFGTLSQASGDIPRSVDYLDSLAQSPEDYLELIHLTFNGEDELRTEKNQTLSSPIMNVGDK